MSTKDNPDWLKEHLQRMSVFKPYKLNDDLFDEMEPSLSAPERICGVYGELRGVDPAKVNSST